MSRITQLTAENVKRLTAVNITPQGNVVVIGGENEAGKSSLLDSIAMLFGGANEIPAMPVRNGADKAKIVAVLDNGLVIKRTFTKAGGTSLVVEAKDGARYPKPQDIMDAMTGKLTFDPLAFTRLDPKKQAEALKKLIGLNFSEQDAARKKLYDERTLVNSNVTRVKIHVGGMPHHPDAPAFALNTADLMAELEKARAHNAQQKNLEEHANDRADVLVDALSGKDRIAKEISDLETRLVSLRSQFAEYEAALVNHKQAAVAADKAVADFAPIDETPIREKLAGAAVTNKKVQENVYREDAVAALKKHEEAAAALTAKIEAIDKNKESQLAAAKFPIDGLGFNDDGLTYNGIPFDQASTSVQIRVAVAMSAALNPKLRVMLVRDGSLLGEKAMALLTELAEKHDLQVWVERVGKNDVSAVIIEDGHVAGAATAPAENVLSHDAHEVAPTENVSEPSLF